MSAPSGVLRRLIRAARDVQRVSKPSPLPALLARTLTRLDAAGTDGVERARSRISEVLSRVTDSDWPEVVDRFSWLTNTGIPFEFAWTSRDAALRWTAEVAPPEYRNHRRLALAGELAFGTDGNVADTLSWLAEQQTGQRLRFGAWLGVRHRSTADEHKVYAEVPEQPAADLALRLGLAPHAAVRTVGLRSRMVGVLGDGSLELYTRSTDLDQRAVRGLELSTFAREDRLWPSVRELVGGERLPRPSGVSIVFAPNGEPVALTWFSFAKALFSSDGATVAALAGRTSSGPSREVLTALAGDPKRRVDPEGRVPATSPLEIDGVSGQAPGRRWHCGMVGVGVAGAGEPWFQVGMRPFE